MSKYYCLIAGLPNISLDDSKLTYSVSEFRKELDGILTSRDKKLVDLFFLKFDNKNLLAFSQRPVATRTRREVLHTTSTKVCLML